MHSEPIPRDPTDCVLHWKHRSYSACERFQDSQFTKDERFSCFYTGANSDIVRITMNTPEPPKLVAIKKIQPRGEEVNDPDGYIQNELAIWSILSAHSHVVPLLGIASISSLDGWWGTSLNPLAVCHYYEEKSLKEFLSNRNLAHIPRLELLKGVAQGLAHTHRSAVVHGDIKSANVVVATVDNKHVAKITDFGSSTLDCWCSPNPNEPVGTIMYNSPELFEDEPRTASSDVWAFGCVVLEVYAGVYPFSGQAYHSNMHIMQIITSLAAGCLPGTDLDFDLTNETSKSVWEMTQQCWRAEPIDRPSAEDLVAALSNIHTLAESTVNAVSIELSEMNPITDQITVHQYSYF